MQGFPETWKLFQGFFQGKKIEKGWSKQWSLLCHHFIHSVSLAVGLWVRNVPIICRYKGHSVVANMTRIKHTHCISESKYRYFFISVGEPRFLRSRNPLYILCTEYTNQTQAVPERKFVIVRLSGYPSVSSPKVTKWLIKFRIRGSAYILKVSG
jgi:hypothetical protein